MKDPLVKQRSLDRPLTAAVTNSDMGRRTEEGHNQLHGEYFLSDLSLSAELERLSHKRIDRQRTRKS